MKLEKELSDHTRILQQTVLECSQVINQIAGDLVECFRRGNKVMLCGNGGSAADSQHMVAEFVNRFRIDRAALPALALTVDTSVLTAIGNDYGYERIFSRQLQALGRNGDVFFGISTSGNSPNILEGLKEARRLGITTIGLTGIDGGKMKPLCDFCFCVPSSSTPRIQEIHGIMVHALCSLIETSMFGSSE